jgi:hypothetical protein
MSHRRQRGRSAAFSLLSFASAKPVVWALITGLVMLAIYGTRAGLVQVVALTALVMLLWSESLSSSDIWSPYYRISVTKGKDIYAVNVNGIPHQNIVPVARLDKVYSLPYQHAPGNPLNDVLIVGAGTGDDAANALHEGARHIDAVEIDPQLYQLGRRLNPLVAALYGLAFLTGRRHLYGGGRQPTVSSGLGVRPQV